ncbi:hypothetical protein Pint_34907 [Pistacia integerrima]|uniref:Uncharacterized protein n=1 Tax=Pistacia integerrima TaxID=434235 RepID=A0ACC0Y067_9ROSI|nr:hypothetical protein Pint_34907 [Pistacia integerrima]
MRNLLSWFFLIIFLANCFGTDVVSVSGQCQSDQQLQLLQRKSGLVFDTTLSVNLALWNHSTDCCHWSGVGCDEAGRVISLNLSNESISGGIENATGLFGLQHLKSLNLAYNRFDGTQIPSSTSPLKVESPNLSNFPLKLEIPKSSTFPLKLKIPTTSLLKLKISNLSLLIQNFTQLRELYLDGVNISAHGSEWCKALSSSLPNLQVLSLSSCFLSGPITSSFAKLRSLSVIRSDQNNLSSPVPKVLAEFMNLTSLRLRNCGLRGTFPQNILQLATLEHLDLSNKIFLQGSLPNFPQNQCHRTLMLTFTNFSGILPDSIANLNNLSRIELSNCNFTGAIPTSMANRTEIVYLDLSFNRFTGPIPSFHRSKNLSYLDLSRNQLTGAIPSNWEQLQNLVYVDLSLNSLNGSIPPSLFNILSLQKLQLANNQIEGQVPVFPDASSSLLDTLDLSGNRLEGPIPMSVFELRDLEILILSSNKLIGTIRLDTIQGLRNLTKLELSYNRLVVNASESIKTIYFRPLSNQISGEVPNWIWEVGNGFGGLAYLNLSHNLLMGLQEPYNLSNLIVLDLDFNQLQGEIPKPPQFAIYVDYSRNFFTSIPADIGTFPPVTVFFSFSNNSLTGVIPESMCNATYLQVLDLSDNSLNGIIPTCLIERFPHLWVLNLRRNNLTGTIPDAFRGNCGLQTLNLNGNQLGGRVPKTLANCKMLEVIDLGNNQITDNFPRWLKEISSFRVLVLRSNKFYGKIGCPEIHGNWSMLQIVDLAYNDFGGKLPAICLTTWKAMMSDEDKAESNIIHLQYELLGVSHLYYQDTVTVTVKGLEVELQKILTIFTSIDLSSNKFEGPIPEEVGQFKSLYALSTSRNALRDPYHHVVGYLSM